LVESLVNYRRIEDIKTLKRASKHPFEFPLVDLKEEAKTMYIVFMDERNLNLLKVEKTWDKIEERNKYFWTSFLPKATFYTLYEGTGVMNEPYILKKNNKKEKLELPRMHRGSLTRSTSMLS
jgi:hypothetical protein